MNVKPKVEHNGDTKGMAAATLPVSLSHGYGTFHEDMATARHSSRFKHQKWVIDVKHIHDCNFKW